MKASDHPEFIRAHLLIETAKWMHPPTAAELEIVKDLTELPTIEIGMIPADTAGLCGMLPQQCHNNCRTFAAQEASGQFRPIVGWKVQRGLYTLHSIVGRTGELMCVTPMHIEADPWFDFIPDQAIEDGEDGFRRKGIEVPDCLRSNPFETIEAMKRIQLGLLSGRDPRQVMVEAAELLPV